MITAWKNLRDVNKRRESIGGKALLNVQGIGGAPWGWLAWAMGNWGRCKCLLLDSPDVTGKQGLSELFYHLYSSRGLDARWLEGQRVRGVSFASRTLLLWKSVLVHLFHFTSGYSLASPQLAVTSSRSAKTLLHTHDKISHSSLLRCNFLLCLPPLHQEAGVKKPLRWGFQPANQGPRAVFVSRASDFIASWLQTIRRSPVLFPCSGNASILTFWSTFPTIQTQIFLVEEREHPLIKLFKCFFNSINTSEQNIFTSCAAASRGFLQRKVVSLDVQMFWSSLLH